MARPPLLDVVAVRILYLPPFPLQNSEFSGICYLLEYVVDSRYVAVPLLSAQSRIPQTDVSMPIKHACKYIYVDIHTIRL